MTLRGLMLARLRYSVGCLATSSVRPQGLHDRIFWRALHGVHCTIYMERRYTTRLPVDLCTEFHWAFSGPLSDPTKPFLRPAHRQCAGTGSRPSLLSSPWARRWRRVSQETVATVLSRTVIPHVKE